MGFEIRYIYHPRLAEGGYDTTKKEEKVVKVGKPFEETPLENLAGVIMSQLARRDIWVVDVEIIELVKKPINFKECIDGKGIIIKNKKFSFNEAAQMVASDVVEEAPAIPEGMMLVPQHPNMQPHEMLNMQPHELVHNQSNLEDLYGNPNKPIPVKKSSVPVKVNQNKILYHVYFEPPIQYVSEAKKFKFQPEKKYPVHQVIPSVTGRLDAQTLAITDDSGKVVQIDEKFFTTAGSGLYGDKDLNFSGGTGRGVRKPRLQYENEMYTGAPDPNVGAGIHSGIPVDDGSLPVDLLEVPDIRARRK